MLAVLLYQLACLSVLHLTTSGSHTFAFSPSHVLLIGDARLGSGPLLHAPFTLCRLACRRAWRWGLLRRGSASIQASGRPLAEACHAVSAHAVPHTSLIGRLLSSSSAKKAIRDPWPWSSFPVAPAPARDATCHCASWPSFPLLFVPHASLACYRSLPSLSR